MDASEFWCRAFLAEMNGTCSRTMVNWENERAPDRFVTAANAALAAAQRRGMVTGDCAAQPRGGVRERAEFTAERHSDTGWVVRTSMYMAGVIAVDGAAPVRMADGNTVHIVWGETCPPKPTEVWIERPKGGA